MALVTSEEVANLIGKAGTDTCQYIEVAHILVSENLSNSGLSDNRKKLVELYLAGHFATISLKNGTLKRKKIGEAEEEYVSPEVGKGLLSTHYGQQAVMLDESGILGALTTSTTKALIRVV